MTPDTLPENQDETPRLVLQEASSALAAWFLRVQHLLTQHPRAARALARALVAEGRRFAETPEGQQWKEILTESEWVRRGRLIWEAYHLDAMLEDEETLIPSAWLDMVASAVATPELETILSTLILEEA
ncbi:MAG: hypothetical protein M5R40_17140 [Anaerolineae bacterium]|nr:hypothetical protein [Anaerolineae bacterium]